MRPKKKISQTDIARELGISTVSVSNALAGRKGVSRELSVKVREKAAHMGYCAGETDVDRLPDGLLLVRPDQSDGNRTERLCGILREQRFRVLSHTASELLKNTGTQVPDLENCLGLVVTEPLPAEMLLALKEKVKKPVVGMGFFNCRVPIDYVTDDGFHGAQRMVQYLRGKGYTEILYVRPTAESDLAAASNLLAAESDLAAAASDLLAAARRAAWDDRELGYRSALYLETLNRGLTMNRARPFDTEEEKNILTMQGALGYIKKQSADVRKQGADGIRTAFFCGDLSTARALKRELAKQKIWRPREVAVAGYAAGEPNGRCASEPDGRCTAQERLIVLECSEKKLLEKCCAVLLDRHRSREDTPKLHLVQGVITQEDTV